MCLCTQYLMNQLADFNQICMYIKFGHDKSGIGFGDLDLIFKITVRLCPPKLSQNVFVCMLSHGPWMECYQICKPILYRFLCCLCLSISNFQGHSSMTEIATIDWFGR